MSEWRLSHLGEISEIQTGPFGSQLLNEQYIKGGTPIITVEHIKDFEIAQLDFPSVSEEDRKRLEKYSLREGDIVFSRVGSVDLSAITKKENEGWLFSSRMLRVRPNNELMDPYFLSYYFRLYKVRKYINSVAVGSTMPSINTSILKTIPIKFPKKEKQKQIAEILFSLDKKIKLLQEQNKTLEQLAQTLFKRWFVDFEFPNEEGKPYKSTGGKMVASELGEIPEGWTLTNLSEVSTKITDGTHSTVKDNQNGKFHLLSCKNIKGYEIVINENDRKIDEKTLQNLHKRTKLQKNDVLITTVGTIGEVAMVWEEKPPYAFQRSVAIVRSNTNLISPEFLFQFTKSNFFQHQAINRSRGSVQTCLFLGAIGEISMIRPEIDILEKASTFFKKSNQKIIENIKEIKSLSELRDTLLPKLMSGEVRVKENINA